MRTTTTEAIILNTEDYGESDRLISFYAGTGGKLRGIARGARKSQKRFVHAFEPCSLVEVTYIEGKSLARIDACKLLEPYLELRTEVERWAYAALLSEIVLEMVPEGETQPEIFTLLKGAIEHLASDRDSLNVVLLFVFRFLDLMGYLPALDGCSVCRTPLANSTAWFWRVGRGQLVCPSHLPVQEDYIELDLGTLVLIQRARMFALEKIWRLRFGREKKSALLYCLLNWIRGQIQKNLKSLRMIEQVRTACCMER